MPLSGRLKSASSSGRRREQSSVGDDQVQLCDLLKDRIVHSMLLVVKWTQEKAEEKEMKGTHNFTFLMRLLSKSWQLETEA